MWLKVCVFECVWVLGRSYIPFAILLACVFNICDAHTSNACLYVFSIYMYFCFSIMHCFLFGFVLVGFLFFIGSNAFNIKNPQWI